MFCCGIDTAQAGFSWAFGPIHLLTQYKHEAAVIDKAGKALLDRISLQIRQLIEQLGFLEDPISALLKQAGSHRATIPGIGDTLGAIILVEIGDIHRFDAPNKLVAFAGLDVRITRSGDFIGTHQKIPKRSSPYFRRSICLAAFRAAFCGSILLECYQSLRVRRKHHFTAIGAVSRKLCNIIFAILCEGRPYETVPPKGIRRDSAFFTT